MRTRARIFLLFTLPLLFAEGADEASPRRRPKSIPRVYDQRATVVDVESMFRGDARDSEETLRPDAMRDSRPRVGNATPVESLPQPLMMVLPSGNETPPEEDRRTPWLRPLDLLGDEEEYAVRDREVDSAEERSRDNIPFEWDRLGEGLSEMEMRREDPSSDEEERENDRDTERFSIRDRETRALTLEPVIREVAGPEVSQNGREAPRTDAMAREAQPVAPLTTLTLTADPRVDMDPGPDPLELPGSRALFNESYQRLERERPNPFRNEGETSRFAPAPRPAAPPRDIRPATSFTPVTSSMPSAVAMPSLTAQPFTPAEFVRPAPPTSREMAAPRQDLMDTRRFRNDDYRIRPAGDGF